MSDQKLTHRQLKFVVAYAADPNGKRAAIAAGYAPKSAAVHASKMLMFAKVSEEISRRLKAQNDRVEIKADDIKRELLRIATADISQAYDTNGQLKPIHEIPEDVRRSMSSYEVQEFIGKDGGTITRKARFWDKTKSLELLGKHLQLFTDVVKHEGKLTLEQLLTESHDNEE